MPFIRTGLCATDQVKCAKMLEAGIPPKAVARALRTTEDVVKKFTSEGLAGWAAKKKGIEVKMIKHTAETKKAASALAGAAKELLNQHPSDPESFE